MVVSVCEEPTGQMLLLLNVSRVGRTLTVFVSPNKSSYVCGTSCLLLLLFCSVLTQCSQLLPVRPLGGADDVLSQFGVDVHRHVCGCVNF